MASLGDVEAALAARISAGCYPAGTSAQSVTGGVVRVFPGYPAAAGLDADMRAGAVCVGVKARDGVGRTVNVSLGGEQVLSVGTPTTSGTVSGRVITLAGTVTTAWPVMVLVGRNAYSHPPSSSDTLASIAAALAARIAVAYPGTTASGAAITVAGTASLAVRGIASGTIATPLTRQTQGFCVTVYAPTAALRDRVGHVSRLSLARSPHLTFPDLTTGLLRVTSEGDVDRTEIALLYERRVLCQVEYDTADITDAWTIGALGGELDMNLADGTWGDRLA